MCTLKLPDLANAYDKGQHVRFTIEIETNLWAFLTLIGLFSRVCPPVFSQRIICNELL
jgi:hypothetical protein